MLRAAAARPKLSLVTPAASSSRHRSRASLCEGSRMCCTVTSRVASFTFPTTSSSQLIAGAAGIRRHATARAVGGIAMKQATSIAFDDSSHRSAARRIANPRLGNAPDSGRVNHLSSTHATRRLIDPSTSCRFTSRRLFHSRKTSYLIFPVL